VLFELSIIRKYLIPRRKQLSVSLIGLMSIFVIALVVWLVLVFLSVTEGIERGWLDKLTSLNAPLRINPTKAYFNSYYYQIDSISWTSNYQEKSIGEKLVALETNPYQPSSDMEIPYNWPQPEKKDLVKEVFAILSKNGDLTCQDYELSGAMMRLQIVKDNTASYLTQASYLASYTENNPYFNGLILPPSIKDINHLFNLASQKISGSCLDEPPSTSLHENYHDRLHTLLSHMTITGLKPTYSHWRIPPELIEDNSSFKADHNQTHILVHDHGTGILKKQKGKLYFQNAETSAPVLLQDPITFKAKLKPAKDLRFLVEAKVQNKLLKGELPFKGLEIASAKIEKPLIFNQEDTGVMLAKSFQDAGVKMGDVGYLAYSAATASSVQEQRVPIYVKGFYDPGIMSVGNKCILVPHEITRTINQSSNSFNFDPTMANGIMVWFKDLKSADKVKADLIKSFEEAGIDKYWKVTTYKEYDFAKDLLQQFQSDKYLFTIVGIIILIVACSNIISLLIIMVNDKKKEIGILQAMGTTKKSIAFIFSSCGLVMGVLGSIIGIIAALLTLHNLDSLVHLLSFIEGHEAFNAAFWGESLPNMLSNHALLFILITTPLISVLAALVPAIKACRINTSSILRSE